MSRRFVLALTIACSVTLAQAQTDSIQIALDAAKRSIAEKNYSAAVQTLSAALDRTATIADARAQANARTALHFYAAAAYAGLRDDGNAKAHLTEFFALAPQSRIDPGKFDEHFVDVFIDAAPRTETRDQFATYYPGYSALKPFETANEAVATGTAVEILGTREEKQRWNKGSTEERQRFMAEFWRRRDATPDTPRNEVREELNRRVLFADHAFTTQDVLGSLSDRGKVFVLLGEPALVRRRALTSRDSVQILDKTIVTGSVEQWVYTRDQLPNIGGKPSISFRFVRQAGIGEWALQRDDAYAMQALATAGAPLRE
ncbi:MAG TPA: GWxTD domain-containing protein [Thermoanaerobaculia bacterium]|nr:GWxTD domain-containing protein [Thermoanaerobaculia bacterium]